MISIPFAEAVALPDFVVTITTPFAALEPYNAAAAAPLSTVIDSILFGSRSPILLPYEEPSPNPENKLLLLLSNGIPLTINNGWLLPSREELPLIVMRVELPGAPLALEIFTPGIFPCRALIASGSATCCN